METRAFAQPRLRFRGPHTPQSEPQGKLNQFLDQIHEMQPDTPQDRAETHWSRWSSGDARWLSRYFDSQHSESVNQLTSQTEDVLKFLAEMLERTVGFVGTESRLTRIIHRACCAISALHHSAKPSITRFTMGRMMFLSDEIPGVVRAY